ncbi:DUF3823 domain-containing protein [Echinicola vietnamensis]|uniref:DUF3823 domain-containing protein n=1 Tax=Echinicola vietnamensis (strain DSM 17526 / LMG 23754 / KMM 6221) TaxID=926556 RepID=L0FVV7_ECHVK|nr:DUF3823 domain-containing protein [Echinicola vietnamensis]AGA76805.1 hypothetical protein Echvi_0521 [Echinicola vietnamensis DSM 17526]
MKLNIIQSCLLLVLGFMVASCEYDNFEEPKSTLTGRIVYEGEPLGVRNQGVQLELWQHGYDLFQKIPVYVSQDGTFSAKLFDGDYKLTLIRGNGPWMDQTDSLDIALNGSQEINVEVNPYFTLDEPSYEIVNDTIVRASFTVNQINAASTLEFTDVYMGRTSLTDIVRNEGLGRFFDGQVTPGTPATVDVTVPNHLRGRSDLFVRVGVKTLGVEELLYSQVDNVSIN